MFIAVSGKKKGKGTSWLLFNDTQKQHMVDICYLDRLRFAFRYSAAKKAEVKGTECSDSNSISKEKCQARVSLSVSHALLEERKCCNSGSQQRLYLLPFFIESIIRNFLSQLPSLGLVLINKPKTEKFRQRNESCMLRGEALRHERLCKTSATSIFTHGQKTMSSF